jgi:hypothetical protein
VTAQNFLIIFNNNNKNMISFITIGRNDNYGGNFLNILHRSLHHNLSEISKINKDFEYILIDWSSPDNDHLSNLDWIKALLVQYPQFRIYNIKQEVITDKNLNPNILYEYYAKNVGINKSQGHLISSQNSDILFSSDLIANIFELSKLEPMPYFFKPEYSVGVKIDSDLEYASNNIEIINIKDLNRYVNDDLNFTGDGFYETKFGTIDFKNKDMDPLGEVASGDIVISYKEHLKDLIKGYDEINPEHRQKDKRQSGMDSEIIYNYVSRNLPVFYLENLYFHVEHSRKDLNRDNVRNLTIWNNPEDWGMEKYKVNTIDTNVYLIFN